MAAPAPADFPRWSIFRLIGFPGGRFSPRSGPVDRTMATPLR
jgi:hypothetical protein